jgi:hypothetical protein
VTRARSPARTTVPSDTTVMTGLRRS